MKDINQKLEKGDAGKSPKPERKKTISENSNGRLLGLESSLFIFRELCGNSSLDKSIQNITDYLLELIDLSFVMFITEDLSGSSLNTKAISAREGVYHYIQGIKYRYGASGYMDKWIGEIFDAQGATKLDSEMLGGFLAKISSEGIISEETFLAIIDSMKTKENLETLFIGRKRGNGQPLFIIALSSSRKITKTELGLIYSLSDSIAAALERRVEIERASRELTRYKALVDSKEHAFFLLIDGKLEFFSEKLPEILGTVKKNLFGKRIETFFDEESARDLVKMICNFNEMEGPASKKYYHIYRLADSAEEVELQIHSIDFRGKRAIRGTVENVSQKSMLEKTAMESIHLESMAKLAGGVAHDFNNLIGAMIGFSSLVRNSLPENDHRVVQLEKIEEAGAKANKLTHQLLSMSRKGNYVCEIVDISEVVDRAAKSCLLSQANISLAKEFRADLCNVKGDPSQLHEAFFNILMNSREAMPDGGNIKIATEKVFIDSTNEIFSNGMTTGDYIRITISDDGIGMAPSVFRRAAEPFFTTRKEMGNKGLGLPAAIGIIEGHQGKMDVRSRENTGTEVMIFLPLTAMDQKNQGGGSWNSKETKKILIIDDEEIILDLAAAMLAMLGYEAVRAESGQKGLEILKSQRIDLVFLDLVMPEMSGDEVFTRIKEFKPDLPIIIASGYSEDFVIQQLLDRGAVSFLKKPYRLKDMAAVMQGAMGVLLQAERKG
ncbi:MAG: response regulator [Candidatus Krumholzibacteriota bacterium]|nr:response regulator [Candidatus Krumholzibacteriota bacterium]